MILNLFHHSEKFSGKVTMGKVDYILFGHFLSKIKISYLTFEMYFLIKKRK